MSAKPGLNEAPLTEWLAANVPGLTPPLYYNLIAGGRSNITYKISDRCGHDFVLRRPPTGHLLATAHDMGREYRVNSGPRHDGCSCAVRRCVL